MDTTPNNQRSQIYQRPHFRKPKHTNDRNKTTMMLVAQALRYRWNRRIRSGEGFVPGSLIWIPVAGALGKLAVALATRVLISVML